MGWRSLVLWNLVVVVCADVNSCIHLFIQIGYTPHFELAEVVSSTSPSVCLNETLEMLSRVMVFSPKKTLILFAIASLRVSFYSTMPCSVSLFRSYRSVVTSTALFIWTSQIWLQWIWASFFHTLGNLYRRMKWQCWDRQFRLRYFIYYSVSVCITLNSNLTHDIVSYIAIL